MNFVNFQNFEVTADTRNAAIEMVESENFGILGDATQAYKNAKKACTTGWTEKEMKQFCLDYLQKKTKMKAGVGYLITVEPAVADTRERPYKIENIKNEEGKRKTTKTLTWIDDNDGHVVCKCQGTKTDAANMLKDLYKSGEYKGNATCRIVYDVTEGNPDVMKASYSPSKNTRKGVYIAFGVKA